MALWQPWRTFFAGKQDFLCPKVREWQTKLYNICKTYSTQRILLDTKNAVLTTQLINIRHKNPKRFCSMPENDGGNHSENLFWKWSYCQVGCSFDNPVIQLSKKSGTIPSLSEQENVRSSSESVSAHLVPMYTLKSGLTTLRKSLSQNDDGFLPNIWKLQKTSKWCYGHVEGRFDNPMKKFLTESRKIFGRCPNK